MARTKRELNEYFWPPTIPDSFDPPKTTRDDPDRDEDRLRELEHAYYAEKRIKDSLDIGDVIAAIFTSIERQCIARENAKQQRLEGIPYRNYLKSDHWLKIREIALDLGKHECRICCSTKYLNVHHRTYERLGREDQDDLVVLCRKCHKLFHETGRLACQSDEGSDE